MQGEVRIGRRPEREGGEKAPDKCLFQMPAFFYLIVSGSAEGVEKAES